MAKFLSNAKTFAKDLARDAIHFPRSTQSWPAFKQSVIELYNETKSDLFFFRRDTLNPVISDITTRLDAAEKSDNAAEKAEKLLELKSETADKLNVFRDAQEHKMKWGIGIGIGAVILTGLVFGGGAMLLPLLAGGAAFAKFATNNQAALDRKTSIRDRIDRDILGMVTGEARAGLFSSPRFQQALVDKGVLKKVFTGAGWGASKDKDFDKMVGRLAKQTVAPPAPAPEKTSP